MTADGANGRTTHSIVIVTRNRPAALSLSLPLLLAEERRAERILVVDSSEDPGENAALVARLADGSATPLRHMPAPAGMTRQRNIGLAEISGDVVIFPDDDSLVHPGAIGAMMRVYDLDAERRIAGVGGRETSTPPPGALGEAQGATYRKKRSDHLKLAITPTRNFIERALVPDPMVLAGEKLTARLPAPPAWLAEENCETVPWNTGFRMSFRSEVIREAGFNEALGRYALYEDIDAGFQALRRGLLVSAGNARIYHHKAPERRDAGRRIGAMQLLNRAYVTARSGALDPALRRATLRQARYKTFLLRFGARDEFGRDRLNGARDALKLLPELLDAPADALDATYLRLRRACLGETESGT